MSRKWGRKDGLCSQCKKPLDGSHSSYCKSCYAAYVRNRRVSDPIFRDKLRARGRRDAKLRRERHPEKVRVGKLINRLLQFGLSREKADLILQQETCEICGVVLIPRGRFPLSRAIDHDASTNMFRGILCFGCNTGLGHFQDDPIRLRAAADYIERSQSIEIRHLEESKGDGI